VIKIGQHLEQISAWLARPLQSERQAQRKSGCELTEKLQPSLAYQKPGKAESLLLNTTSARKLPSRVCGMQGAAN
jgi:hypothetical protein